jgi:hypothetical protein
MVAHVSATINDLKIQDQQLLGRVNVEGDSGGYGDALMVVYDAGGTERHRTDLGKLEAGQQWDLTLDVLGGGLEDGDYGAWIYLLLTTADGSAGVAAQQGVSFLVGRGEVYPSGEAADRRHFDNLVEPSNLRLEGSWIVFDMKNTARFDVEVAHSLAILNDATTPHKANGEELVRAGATQQGHYLLPEQMADGRYFVSVVVQAQGSDMQLPVGINIDLNQGVVTVAP